jgi:hypothetical protein
VRRTRVSPKAETVATRARSLPLLVMSLKRKHPEESSPNTPGPFSSSITSPTRSPPSSHAPHTPIAPLSPSRRANTSAAARELRFQHFQTPATPSPAAFTALASPSPSSSAGGHSLVWNPAEPPAKRRRKTAQTGPADTSPAAIAAREQELERLRLAREQIEQRNREREAAEDAATARAAKDRQATQMAEGIAAIEGSGMSLGDFLMGLVQEQSSNIVAGRIARFFTHHGTQFLDGLHQVVPDITRDWAHRTTFEDLLAQGERLKAIYRRQGPVSETLSTWSLDHFDEAELAAPDVLRALCSILGMTDVAETEGQRRDRRLVSIWCAHALEHIAQLACC